MRRIATLFVFVLAALLLSSAANQETLEQLKARAQKASKGEQPRLFVEVARRALQEADDAFNAGDSDRAQAGVRDVVSYSESAAEAARASRKHVKRTEISLREIARRLDQMGHTVNFDDRPPIKAAVERLEQLRTELLAQMFEHK
jgi:hypothetical protein